MGVPMNQDPRSGIPKPPVFIARGLSKVYGTGETQVIALRGVDLDIWPGEFRVLLGPSGSGTRNRRFLKRRQFTRRRHARRYLLPGRCAAAPAPQPIQ